MAGGARGGTGPVRATSPRLTLYLTGKSTLLRVRSGLTRSGVRGSNTTCPDILLLIYASWGRGGAFGDLTTDPVETVDARLHTGIRA